MRILVVSYLFSAVRKAIKSDGEDAKGMPGFLKAMQYFSNNGIHIDYVFYSNISEDLELPKSKSMVSYIPTSSIKAVVIRKEIVDRYSFNFFFSQKLKKTVTKLLENDKYDFIYLTTPLSVSINHLANKLGIPCGMRLFGSFLWGFLQENGDFKTRFYCRDEINAYNTSKSFLLTTNDGSHGNDSYNKFCKNKTLYPFYYWINGVDRFVLNQQIMKTVQETIDESDILYIATITGWKRQDRALETFTHLKNRNVKCRLLLIGDCPPESKPWKLELDRIITKNNLKNDVIFTGSMVRENFLYLALKSKACLLLQDTTNMGNVFHELFSVGAVIVALNDGSLDGFVMNGINGFLVNDTIEAANVIEDLINNKINDQNIRKNARETSQKLLLSWDERLEKELRLIKHAVEGKV